MADEPTQTTEEIQEKVENSISENSENSEKPVDQTISESEKGAEETSEQTSDPSDLSDKSDTPSNSDPAKRDSEEAKPKKATKPVSQSLQKIVESIEKLTVLELAELVHALEDKFGVSASAPIAAASGVSAPAGATEPIEEQTTFNVILTASGANKIASIKAVRELVPTLGLKEAKDLVEAAPKLVLEGVNKATAQDAKNKLTSAGATAELQ